MRFFGPRKVVTLQHCRGTARNDEGEVKHDKDVLNGFFLQPKCSSAKNTRDLCAGTA